VIPLVEVSKQSQRYRVFGLYYFQSLIKSGDFNALENKNPKALCAMGFSLRREGNQNSSRLCLLNKAKQQSVKIKSTD